MTGNNQYVESTTAHFSTTRNTVNNDRSPTPRSLETLSLEAVAAEALMAPGAFDPLASLSIYQPKDMDVEMTDAPQEQTGPGPSEIGSFRSNRIDAGSWSRHQPHYVGFEMTDIGQERRLVVPTLIASFEDNPTDADGWLRHRPHDIDVVMADAGQERICITPTLITSLTDNRTDTGGWSRHRLPDIDVEMTNWGQERGRRAPNKRGPFRDNRIDTGGPSRQKPWDRSVEMTDAGQRQTDQRPNQTKTFFRAPKGPKARWPPKNEPWPMRACPICERGFRKSRLAAHIRKHEERHKCREYNLQFKLRAGLNAAPAGDGAPDLRVRHPRRHDPGAGPRAPCPEAQGARGSRRRR